MHANRERLQVQKDLYDVFLYTFDTRVFVEHTIYIGLHDSASGHAREEHTPQRITESMTEATLEGLDKNPGPVSGLCLNAHSARLQELTN